MVSAFSFETKKAYSASSEIELMEIFEENPTQAGRNNIIRKMAVFNRDKNQYMAQLKNIVLKGNEKVNLKNVYNYNKSRK